MSDEFHFQFNPPSFLSVSLHCCILFCLRVFFQGKFYTISVPLIVFPKVTCTVTDSSNNNLAKVPEGRDSWEEEWGLEFTIPVVYYHNLETLSIISPLSMGIFSQISQSSSYSCSLSFCCPPQISSGVIIISVRLVLSSFSWTHNNYGHVPLLPFSSRLIVCVSCSRTESCANICGAHWELIKATYRVSPDIDMPLMTISFSCFSLVQSLYNTQL